MLKGKKEYKNLFDIKKQPLLFYFILFFLSVLFYFCSNISASETPGKLIIIKPFGPSIKLPDPAKGSNGWYTSEAGITETLFVLDFNLNLKPWLAESFKNINEYRWEIKLKKNLLFHDNTPVTAHMVKVSIDRVINKNSKVFNKSTEKLLDIKSITVQDEVTLLFETNSPNAAFLYGLTSPATGIIKHSICKKKIHGTGPFILTRVIPGEQLIVTRFENYWGGKPLLSKVYLKTVINPSTRMLAFEARQVDIVINFPEIDASRIASRKDTKIIHKPSTRVCFFFIRVADGPLSDSRIRMAINYAINREEIVNSVLYGIGGKPGGSIFPEILPWSNKKLKPYPYDPDKALNLLKKAGAIDSDNDGILEINGSPLVLNAWTYKGRSSLKPTLELVRTHLKKVGILLRIRVTKKGSPINLAMGKGHVHLNLQMWNVAPYGDPDYFISNVFTTDAGPNIMGYFNKELNILAEKGKKTFDFNKRKKIYNRIQEIIYKESPVIVLFSKEMVCATYDHVKNYHIHPAEKYILTNKLFKKQP